MMLHNETICAIATAPGGAIGIIRVSGEDTFDIVSKIFTPINPNSLKERKPYSLVFGHIYNEQNEVIDEVLVSLFKSPHSYTGEDAIEISCHGSSYILQQVMQRLIACGCRLAQPGEFTQRAFLNGKMDLSQAEAVADLIASSSAATHRLAMNQMRGGFSRELKTLRDQLLHLTTLLELELDFSDHEDLEFANRDDLTAISHHIKETIAKLVDSFGVGNAIKNGIPVAIVGETNAGKSTLLNTLLHEEKAIVSNIHGTTRDVIEDTINIAGITFRFIDTAGIRETTDEIEHMGIQRTFQNISKASIVFWVVDASSTAQLKETEKELQPYLKDKHIVLIFNKCDLINEAERAKLKNLAQQLPYPTFYISAKNKENIIELEAHITHIASIPNISQNDIIVTNVRHYNALNKALESINRVINALSLHLPGDLISQDLRETIYHLEDIIGEVSSDSILQNIFKNFCIGK